MPGLGRAECQSCSQAARREGRRVFTTPSETALGRWQGRVEAGDISQEGKGQESTWLRVKGGGRGRRREALRLLWPSLPCLAVVAPRSWMVSR